MTLTAYDASAGVFVRGLTNLKAQLTKARAQLAELAISEDALLHARLPQGAVADGVANSAPYDLHGYTLAAQVHWATEGATLAIARLLGDQRAPSVSAATTFADLHDRIDATIHLLQGVAPADLDAALDRPIVAENRRGSVSTTGDRFLLGYAIPHFFYHVATAYGILRSQGVRLTMGDYLGNWGA